ncbi:endonuclease/exonuclease/phosphatase family protein [Congregibacter variabilis]|uniref:Endonuclease/exonuclease/phosphatase family protein n=1 Tax=Congregibacter variabilis TaxID=3081200 RepID=A0ABZ0I6M3_9GAMM|nr:endonuclease/exonuclease/phosphatase family protein [Congregibacter sp. IMCC43200]
MIFVVRFTYLFFSAVLSIACSSTQGGPIESVNELREFQGLQLAPLVSADQCRESLALSRPVSSAAIDSSNIKILNWNIKKGEEQGWALDLQRLSKGTSLVLLQEAAFSMDLPTHVEKTPFAAFSPGYINKDDITGVVTFSEVRPVQHCRLGAVEPWLGTPKSTNVTRYALSNTEHELMVVNIHAVNFSFGLLSYHAQLNEIADLLSDHQGPVIVSGDLNTWRRGRQQALLTSMQSLGLQTVKFANDLRKTVFGMPLDHIFTRGLSVEEAVVFDVSSSDHNPMTVSFALSQ